MAGGHLLPGSRVVHVLDAVPAQHQSPIGLGLLRELRHDILIHPGGLVELAGQPQPVGPAEQGQLLLIVYVGNRLLRAAVLALRHGHALGDLQVPAAHFTFDNGHSYFLHPFSPCQIDSFIQFDIKHSYEI